MNEALYQTFNFYASNATTLVKKLYEIKKENISSLTNYNIRLPLDSLLKNAEIKITNEMKGLFKEFKEEIEFLGYDYNSIKKDLDKIINDLITYSNNISSGTLFCSNDLIKMRLFEKTREGLDFEGVDELLILKTINKFAPKLIDLYREKTNGKVKNPLKEFIYEEFLNNHEKDECVLLKVTASEELPIFNKEEENPLFNNIEEYVEKEYLETLISLSSLKVDKNYFTQGAIVAKLLMRYGFIIDKTNLEPSEIKITKNQFNIISEKALEDFLSDNIKEIFKKYSHEKPLDKLRIFNPQTNLITEGSLFEIYKNEIEYINMRFNDFKEINYLNLNEYLKSIVSTFFNYHQMIFNQKLEKVVDKNELKRYADFANNLWNVMDQLTTNNNWEHELINHLERVLKPAGKNDDNMMFNNIKDVFRIQRAILSLTNSAFKTFLETETGTNHERLKELIEMVREKQLIDLSCIYKYNKAISTLRTSRGKEDLNNALSTLSKSLLKSAYKNYSEDEK
ncbi:hypothetical protein GF352_00115 [archaeon]|nr:hypothetical protein [archaeon]